MSRSHQKAAGDRAGRGTARRRATGSVFARPAVLAPIALLVLAFAGWLWLQQRAAAEARAERTRLLQLVQSATTRAEPDRDELSRLAADIAACPDHETAPDLLAAMARIELARGRPERAQALFGVVAASPAASPEQQGLGAAILIRLHETDVGDAAAATGMLREAEALAARAYDASRDPADLLRAWQAATRLRDEATADRHATALVAAAPDAPATRLVQLATTFEPKTTSPAEVAALRAEFAPIPPELEVLYVMLLLQAGDVRAAAAAAEELLLRAPGVFAVRVATAVVFHACGFGYPAGSVERAQWLRRRDPQLDWLLSHAPADDARRARWTELRTQR